MAWDGMGWDGRTGPLEKVREERRGEEKEG